MVNCFLCFSDSKRRKFVSFRSILSSSRTVADVVQEFFPAVPQNIADKPSICSKCFTTMKDFSELVDIVQITHSFPKISLVKCEQFDLPIKTEPEEQFEIASAFDFYASCDMQGFDEAKEEFDASIKYDDDDETEHFAPPPAKSKEKKSQLSKKDKVSDVKKVELPSSYEPKPLPKPKVRKPKKEKDEEYLPAYLKPKIDGRRRKTPPPRDDKAEKFAAQNINIKCYVCQAKVLTFTQLVRHFRYKHPKRSVYLLCCDKIIRGRIPFYEHVQIVHMSEGAAEQCKLCDKKFTTSFQFYMHNYQYHPKVECKTCGVKVPTEGALETHTDWHRYDECKFECYRCKHECRGYLNLKTHMSQSHLFKKIKIKSTKIERQCDRCGFVCTHPRKFYKHMAMHRDMDIIAQGGGVACLKCEKFFASETKLRVHYKYSHEKIYERTICEICSKSVRCITTHMLVHQETDRVKCPHCSRYLKSELVLQKHIKRLHRRDPNKTYQCKHCGKVAASEGALWSHVKLNHKLKRNLPCRFCPKLMKTPTDVKEHEATHTGIDLYFCEWCPKSFKFGASYRGHRKREHKGEYIPRSESKKFVPIEVKSQ